MPIAKISSKGWLVIPAELRRKYGLESGQYLSVIDYGGVLSLVPQLKDPVEEGMGSLKRGSSLVQALLESRTRERVREKKKLKRFLRLLRRSKAANY
jgi:AbrB family looped-hinge helix DNA binding protein